MHVLQCIGGIAQRAYTGVVLETERAAGRAFPRITMATNATRPQPARSVTPSAQPLASSAASGEAARKPSGYGLPCAKCRLYYAADLDACPTCHHNVRVAPVVPNARPQVAQTSSPPVPDSATIEQEREEFLRQFRSQLLEAHAEVVDVAESFCVLPEHHASEPASAEICKPCYEGLQEHLDVCEAALHMDLKEAAQIVYDAVWADASDPSKTYQNAANALLTELRKRAGMTSLLGPFHPLSH